jgi:hypothetical protein
MKAALVAAALALPMPALSAMPISGAYGDAPGCADYLGIGYSGSDWEDSVYVAPDVVAGFEWACLPSSVVGIGNTVNLLCAGADGLISPEVVPMTIRENADGTLTYDDRVLSLCPPRS